MNDGSLQFEDNKELFLEVYATMSEKLKRQKGDKFLEETLATMQKERYIPYYKITELNLFKTKDISQLKYMSNLTSLNIYGSPDLDTLGNKKGVLKSLNSVSIYGVRAGNRNFEYEKLSDYAPNVKELSILADSYEEVFDDKDGVKIVRKNALKEAQDYVEEYIKEKNLSLSSKEKKEWVEKLYVIAQFHPIELSNLGFKNVERLNISCSYEYLPLFGYDKLKYLNIEAGNVHDYYKGRIVGLDSILKRGNVKLEASGVIEDRPLQNIDYILNPSNGVTINATNFMQLIKNISPEQQNDLYKKICNSNVKVRTGYNEGGIKIFSAQDFITKMIPIFKTTNNLCRDKKDVFEKVATIYNYIANNYKFDNNHLNNPASYNGISTFYNKKGVCCGLTEMFVLMCQTQGVNMELEQCALVNENELTGVNHAFARLRMLDTSKNKQVSFYFDVIGDLQTEHGKEYDCCFLTNEELNNKRITDMDGTPIKRFILDREGANSTPSIQKDLLNKGLLTARPVVYNLSSVNSSSDDKAR